VSAVGPASLPLPHVDRRRLHYKPVPVKTWYVYVNDFIGPVQGGWAQNLHDKRILLSSLDEVLCHLDDEDNVHRQDPAFFKKMLKGDATWAMQKIILSWVIDTCAMTIQLPSHRVTRLFEILDSIAPK
jgi:hypothetical protein